MDCQTKKPNQNVNTVIAHKKSVCDSGLNVNQKSLTTIDLAFIFSVLFSLFKFIWYPKPFSSCFCFFVCLGVGVLAGVLFVFALGFFFPKCKTGNHLLTMSTNVQQELYRE